MQDALTFVNDFLPAWFPKGPALAQLVTSALVVFLALHVILVSCAYAIWLERRLSAWMQDREPSATETEALL